MKLKIITLFIIILPYYGYGGIADNQANNGHSWLEANNGITKMILDETDSNNLRDQYGNVTPTVNENNVVYITGAPARGTILGASCNSKIDCEAKNSAVVMDGGNVWSIVGAESLGIHKSLAMGNVYINNYAQVNSAYGSYIFDANSFDWSSSDLVAERFALGNAYLNDNAKVVEATGAMIAINQPAGYLTTTLFSEGNVYLNNNAQADVVMGADIQIWGWRQGETTAKSVGNVYLNDHAIVNKKVVGAYASNVAYTGPQFTLIGNVYLKDNAQAATIIGAEISQSSLYTPSTDNTVTAQGNVSILDNATVKTGSELWGSNMNGIPFNYYQIFNNNTLTMGANSLSVAKLGNFENYNFYLNDYNKDAIANGTALITVTDEMKNDQTIENDGSATGKAIANQSIVEIKGISGVGIVEEGSTITLIDANGATFTSGDKTIGNIGGLFKTETGDKTTDIQIGLVGKADATYAIDNTHSQITATINNIRLDKDLINTNVKPLAEGRLAALQNVTRGTDLLMSNMGENKPINTYTSILSIDGGLNKYNSGSHIDSRDYRLMIGTRYQFLDNLYAGIVAEYGRSNYDTYNHIASKKIDGNGHTYNYGLSVFGKYTHNLALGNIYTDVAISIGKTSTEFKSNDIIMGSGDTAHYKSKTNYLSGLIGTGYIYPINNTSSLDSSIHYIHTRLGSDSVILDGDKVNFKKSTSSRAQLKEQYNYKANDRITLYLAGSYEYEFNSKAKANVSGISIDAPNVKGATGIMELGIKGTPLANNKNFSFDIKIKGYGGKRDGASISALIGYKF